MKTVKIIKSGSRSDNSFYALIQKEEEGFILSGFVKTTTLLEVGMVDIPASVEKCVEYKA